MFGRRRGVSRFAISRRRRRFGLRSRRSRFGRFRRHSRFVRRRTRRFHKGSLATRRRAFKRFTRRRRTRPTITTPHVFPKRKVSFRNKIFDALQEVQSYKKTSYNKIALPLLPANFGAPCWWAIPYDPAGMGAGALITAATQFYPMMALDLTTIYQRSLDPESIAVPAWPLNAQMLATQSAAGAFAGVSPYPGNQNTSWPLSALRLRMGMFYTYSIQNISNIPLRVRAYKICARHDIDKATFFQNILNEYCGQLWNSGVLTSVGVGLTESTMANAFHNADYDFFSANTMLQDWKIMKVKTFILNPAKGKTFSVRVKARTWRMRRWFNDFPTANEPVVADCPWYRFKGVPEYVFRMEPLQQGGVTGENLWPNVEFPDYSVPTADLPCAVNLQFRIRYHCKPVIPLATKYDYDLGTSGQSAIAVANKIVVDTDFNADTAHVQ